jgi:hypothetical protein
MLVVDALEGNAPQLVAILGTRTATLDMGAFKLARKKMVEAVRRRWPEAEYAYEVEFTTGYGPRSGGLRRPHWNWFWKGIPRADWWVASWVIVTTWCRYVDAEPGAQYVDVIRNEVGLTKYVTEHFMKASQRPPEGFSGQRFCCSRGYFGQGVSVTLARARARESLRLKRELWKATRAGHGAHDAELIARQALELAHRTVWVLANDRGARVGAEAHDRRRQVLPSDRYDADTRLARARWLSEDCEDLWARHAHDPERGCSDGEQVGRPAEVPGAFESGLPDARRAKTAPGVDDQPPAPREVQPTSAGGPRRGAGVEPGEAAAEPGPAPERTADVGGRAPRAGPAPRSDSRRGRTGAHREVDGRAVPPRQGSASPLAGAEGQSPEGRAKPEGASP